MAPSYLVALVLVLLDQWSKAWALANLGGVASRPFLPGLLQLRLVFNTGAAFSVMEGNALLLGLVSLTVAAGLVFWIQTSGPLRRLQWIGLGLLLGGAIGNGLDRWRLGRVVDLFEFLPVSFPVFNVADIAINLAVLCLALDLLHQRFRPLR
jgi:signal peptidase II